MIKLYDYALDTIAIQDNFDDLTGNLFSVRENKKLNTTINTFPNPVSEKLNVDISNFSKSESISVKLVNVVGNIVYEAELQSGNNNTIVINTSALKTCIYVLMAESASKQAIGKILIQH